ncbi:MAG: efflux transporter outer membrane subunit [Planctomycetota bacterium]
MPLPLSQDARNRDNRTVQRRKFASIFPLAILATLAVISLSGCRLVGPDFDGAPIPNLEAEFQAAPVMHALPQADPVDFWASFSDPTLDQLVGQALANNLSVKKSAERIIEARAKLHLSGGQLLPDMNYNSEYAFTKQSLNARPFVGPNGKTFSLFSRGFDSVWEIDLFGRIERGIESAEAELELQHANLADVQQILTADVATSYFSIRQIQEQFELVKASLELQHRTAELVEGRAEAGNSIELDREQTTAFIHRSTAQLATLEQQLELEFNRMSILLGEAPSDALRVFIGYRPIPVASLSPQTGIPADLLRRRPDVRRAEAAVHSATAQIGIAESDLYPSLSLIGTISLSAKDVTKLFQTESLAFSVGPSFRWNILHFGRICDNIDIQESRFRQSIADFQQAVLTAVKEVEDSMISYAGFQRQWIEFDRARKADEKAVRLSLEQYEVGEANFQRVLDAQLQLLQDSRAAIQARANSITQLVRLYKSTGGGWPGPTSHSSGLDASLLLTPPQPVGKVSDTVQSFKPEFPNSDPEFESDETSTSNPSQQPSNDLGEPPANAPDGSTPWDQGSFELDVERWKPSIPVPQNIPPQRHSQLRQNDSATLDRYPLGQGIRNAKLFGNPVDTTNIDRYPIEQVRQKVANSGSFDAAPTTRQPVRQVSADIDLNENESLPAQHNIPRSSSSPRTIKTAVWESQQVPSPGSTFRPNQR